MILYVYPWWIHVIAHSKPTECKTPKVNSNKSLWSLGDSVCHCRFIDCKKMPALGLPWQAGGLKIDSNARFDLWSEAEDYPCPAPLQPKNKKYTLGVDVCSEELHACVSCFSTFLLNLLLT